MEDSSSRSIAQPQVAVVGQTAPAQKRAWHKLFLTFLIIIGKSSKIAVIFKALKLLKFGKPLVTILSMGISGILYGMVLGPWFAVGLMVMLFVHEMGHVVAMRMKGMVTPGPVFIPFLGAALFVPGFKDRDTEAFVGFGGPFIGTVAALLLFCLWPFTDGKVGEIILLVSHIGIMINVFNLIPISPLDGGRITQTIGTWFKYIGIAVLALYTMAARQPALILIWILMLESFENLKPIGLRSRLALGLTVGMTGLMLFGFGEQHWWIDLIDICIALLWTGGFWLKDQRKATEVANEPELPLPSKAVRRKWLLSYLGLTAVAIGALVLQAPHLPEEVKTRAETLSSPSEEPGAAEQEGNHAEE